MEHNNIPQLTRADKNRFKMAQKKEKKKAVAELINGERSAQ